MFGRDWSTERRPEDPPLEYSPDGLAPPVAGLLLSGVPGGDVKD